MSDYQLEFVDASTDPYLNILLYGAAKTGKTVGAASAPGPILYLNGDRPNATRYAQKLYGENMREVKVDGLATMIAVIEELQKEDHPYASVVVDPVSELYRMTLEGLSGRALSPQIQQYGDAGTHLERFCRSLCELPVHVVFICWEQAVKDEESGRFERLPFTTTNTGSPVFAGKLMAMVDVIGYTGVDAGDGESAPKYLAQLVPAGGRKGGDRFGGVLGRTREVNISEWVNLTHETISSD